MNYGFLLLVEDNPGDVRLIMEAMKELNLYGILSVVRDGMEALDFLHQRGKYAGVPRPDLILLDLKLPRKSGFEVLQEVRGTPEFSTIPVVVLSGSESDEDVQRTYELRASSYLTKPSRLEDFVELLRGTINYWFQLARRPPAPVAGAAPSKPASAPGAVCEASPRLAPARRNSRRDAGPSASA